MFESIAYAAPAAAAAENSPLVAFVPFIPVLVIMYFFLIRPQQKRQAEVKKMVEELKKGDRVVTAGGIMGTITSIQNDYVVLKVGESETTKIEVLKNAITGLRP